MRCLTWARWLLGTAAVMGSSAQTQLDLRTQTRNVDFSGVPTKTFRTGSVLPATCSVGETFFRLGAPAGKSFYGCTAQNVWTLQGPPDLPDTAGQSGKVLSTDGSTAAWTGIAGDVFGTLGSLLVQGLQGRAVSNTAPADGQALEWNRTAQHWEPGTPSTTLSGDANGPSGSTVVKGLQGRGVSVAAPSDGQGLKWSAASNQWEPGSWSVTLAGDANGPSGSTTVNGLRGRWLSVNTPVDGQALKWNGALNQWEPGTPNTTLAGDASGPASATVVSGLYGRGIASSLPANGQALTWNATANQWEPGVPSTSLNGDANGPANNTVVRALQGLPVSTNFPTNGQALKWNGTLNQWEPGTPSTTLTGDANGPAGATAVTGLQRRAVSAAAPAHGQALEWNGNTNQWEPTPVSSTVSGDATGPLSNTVVQAVQGRSVSPAKPTDGQALTWNAAVNQWQPGTVTNTLAGDASGPAASTVVKGIQGRTVSTAAPADGQSLEWNAAASQWAPGSPSVTLAGDAGGPAASTVVRGVQGRTVSSAAPTDGQSLKWNATASQWEPGSPSVTLAGDAGGAASATVVKGLQGRPLSTAAPADGQNLRWNATLNQWEPGSTAANYSASFTSQTSVTIPGSSHGYPSANLLVSCYDSTETLVEPSRVSVDSTTYDVTVRFSVPQSGSCVINGNGSGGSGQSGGGGTSSVTSVFGRAGAVVGVAGDYNFSQIAGTLSNGQLPTGIDVGKIGAGTVGATAFGTLANVRSDIQAQLDGKAALSHSHSLSGDATGDLSAVVVRGIQSRPVAATSPADGQVLSWNASTTQWEPHTPNATSGTLSALAVTLSSPTVLTLGASCSAATPCNVRFGNTVQSIQTPSTATVAGGTGTAFIYVDQNGVLTVGHSMTVNCSVGCQSEPGITTFPYDVIPIATWGAVNGVWNQQGNDWRSWLSTQIINAGQGIVVVEAGTATTIAVDTALVPTYLKGHATLAFPSIQNGACADDGNISVPGASPGDAVVPGWPGTLQRGLFGTMLATALDTVSVRLCNLSGMTIYPALAIYSATIIRSF